MERGSPVSTYCFDIDFGVATSMSKSFDSHMSCSLHLRSLGIPGNIAASIERAICCCINRQLSRITVLSQPLSVDTTTDLAALGTAGFLTGQQVYVRSVDAFFYFVDFGAGPAPVADGITVTTTTRGGNTRFLRVL